jgi:hypothetical protein
MTVMTVVAAAVVVVVVNSEYVTDLDVEVVRAAIRAVGYVAVRVAQIAEFAVDKLLGMLDLEIEYVTATTLVVMKDILRRYPEQANTGTSPFSLRFPSTHIDRNTHFLDLNSKKKTKKTTTVVVVVMMMMMMMVMMVRVRVR